MSNPWVKALCIVATVAVSIWLLTFPPPLALPSHSWIDGHHIIHWSDGGPTELDNLVNR